jgi:phospholipid/cholesterol/gamma-HCH transport system substrate-binding protein
MKPFHERNPVTLAIAGTLVIVALLALAFNVKRLPFIGNGPTYYADFTDASGLTPGEEVRIAGIKVGEVSSVAIAGTHVRVGFHVKGAAFGPATTAAIEIKSLLGEHYLSLDPRGLGQLPAGATIGTRNTTTPFNVVPAFDQLSTKITDINTAQLAQSFNTLAKSFSGTGPEVHATLTGLSRLSNTIASRDQQIQDLIAHTNGVSGAIASRDQQIRSLITAANEVLTDLDQRRAAIHQLLVGAQAVSRQLIGLVHDNAGQLHPALVQLRGVVAVLKADDKQLGQTIQAGSPFVRLFVNTIGTGHWFDSTVQTPRGLAACDNTASDPLSALLDPILSAANQKENGSNAPCLPLGPAPGTSK